MSLGGKNESDENPDCRWLVPPLGSTERIIWAVSALFNPSATGNAAHKPGRLPMSSFLTPEKGLVHLMDVCSVAG